MRYLWLPFLSLFLLLYACGDKHAGQFNLARQAIDEGNLPLAEQILSNIITADADNAAAYNNRAIVRMKMERYDEAMVDAEKAIGLNQEDQDYQVTKANILYEQSAYSEARKHLGTIIESGTDEAYPYYLLANVLIQIEDYEGAMIWLERALKKDGQFLLAREQLPVVYTLQKDYSRAIEAYDELIRDTSENDQYFANRGFAYLESGNLTNALQDLRKAVELNAENAYALNNLGHAEFLQGDTLRAMGHINRSVELDGENSHAYHNRGMVHLAMGETRQACTDWESALDLATTTDLEAAIQQLLTDHCKAEGKEDQ